MAKLCIVCGGHAGSGEHVFPASLGGRRVNTNIYCTEHDNGYSSLVAELANQLDVFNAHLGVIPDHGKVEKSVFGTEAVSGRTVRISASKSEFAEPRVNSQTAFGNGVLMDMSFPNHQSIKDWIAQQEANGVTVTIQSKGIPKTYVADQIQYRRKFGGPCGLGAVAYVTQTHLAQEFPELVRSGALSNFIAYTQAVAKFAQKGGCEEPQELESEENIKAREEFEHALSPWRGDSPIWWDFNVQPDVTPNKFAFGHRVTVGVDAEDGQIYGRLSFFSTLHFSMCFGHTTSTATTKTVTIDINPLAEYQKPEHDIAKVETATALARVEKPASTTAGLSQAVQNGGEIFNDLLQRMADHSLVILAKKMHSELSCVSSLSPFESDELFRNLIDSQSQQVWKLTKWVVVNSKKSFPEGPLSEISPMLDSLVAHDASASNGLSALATATLESAKVALITQMKQDSVAGILDERRIAALLGGEVGAAVVGQLVLSMLLMLSQSSR